MRHVCFEKDGFGRIGGCDGGEGFLDWVGDGGGGEFDEVGFEERVGFGTEGEVADYDVAALLEETVGEGEVDACERDVSMEWMERIMG